jgi:RES domain-containing protein
VLDFRFAGLSRTNRWNDAGIPTLYLAGDRGVAIAEWARHLEERPAAARRASVDRELWQVDVSVDSLLDLRDPAVLSTISLSGGEQFLDADLARATARFVRELARVQALLVPSLAFLDDPTRWNLVVYIDRLPHVDRSIRRPRRAGTFRASDA